MYGLLFKLLGILARSHTNNPLEAVGQVALTTKPNLSSAYRFISQLSEVSLKPYAVSSAASLTASYTSRITSIKSCGPRQNGGAPKRLMSASET